MRGVFRLLSEVIKAERSTYNLARTYVEAMRMNKKRLGSLSMRHWGLLLAMAVLTIAYANFADSPSLMAAVTTRELPVYNVDTEEKVLSVSFDAAWGRANTEGILDLLDQYGVKAKVFLVALHQSCESGRYRAFP